MNPFNDIAKMLHNTGRMHAKNAATSVGLSLGTITDSGVLLDDFEEEITNYLVADYLNIPSDVMAKSTDNAVSVKTPAQLLPLQTGDRVIVAPVNGGHDFVILARAVRG